MLKRLLKNKEPLLSCIGVLGIKSDLCEADWIIIEQPIIILEFSNTATNNVSAAKVVTLSKTIVLGKILMQHMKKMEANKNLVKETKDLVPNLIQGIKKRLDPISTDDVAAKAVFLDPRYKEEGFMNDIISAFNNTYEEIMKMLIVYHQENLDGIEPSEPVESSHEAEDRMWEGTRIINPSLRLTFR